MTATSVRATASGVTATSVRPLRAFSVAALSSAARWGAKPKCTTYLPASVKISLAKPWKFLGGGEGWRAGEGRGGAGRGGALSVENRAPRQLRAGPRCARTRAGALTRGAAALRAAARAWRAPVDERERAARLALELKLPRKEAARDGRHLAAAEVAAAKVCACGERVRLGFAPHRARRGAAGRRSRGARRLRKRTGGRAGAGAGAGALTGRSCGARGATAAGSRRWAGRLRPGPSSTRR